MEGKTRSIVNTEFKAGMESSRYSFFRNNAQHYLYFLYTTYYVFLLRVALRQRSRRRELTVLHYSPSVDQRQHGVSTLEAQRPITHNKLFGTSDFSSRLTCLLYTGSYQLPRFCSTMLFVG